MGVLLTHTSVEKSSSLLTLRNWERVGIVGNVFPLTCGGMEIKEEALIKFICLNMRP
jgi:hypothetical protein